MFPTDLQDALSDAIVVAQIDEYQIAVIALAVDPARQANLPADIGLPQGAAGVCPISVHEVTGISMRAGPPSQG